jgi:hypothetical protein
MNFTQVVAEVIATLKRPDKILAARREVNAAVTSFSANQNYARDVHEQLLAIDPLEYTQVLLFTDLTRYRAMKYMKRAGTKNYLSKLAASELGSSCDLVDMYYVVGAGIKISMVTKASSLDIAYYQYPPYLTDLAPDYWMLESGWSMVYNRALAKLFADIGDDASARTHEAYARADYAIFDGAADKDLGYA